MLPFVDESGDLGRRFDRGSSRYFIVVLVIFADDGEALRCDERIAALRRELRLPPRYEFHFSHNSNRVREAVLTAAQPFRFTYHLSILDKEQAARRGHALESDEGGYRLAASLAFESARSILEDAVVVIDGSRDRRFRGVLSRYLRALMNENDARRRISRVKIQRSDGNNLLQLADYIAGVNARALLGKPDGERWHRYLRGHEAGRTLWPERHEEANP